MGKVIDWRGSKDFHPATFIQEEMDARNWTRDRMAAAMAAATAGDPGRMRLELGIYLLIAPNDDRMRLGPTGKAIAAAFGLSEEFFTRLESAWLSARGVSTSAAP